MHMSTQIKQIEQIFASKNRSPYRFNNQSYICCKMKQIKEEYGEQVDFRIVRPQIRCKSDYKIDKFCINKDCKFPSLSCREEKCYVCSQNHEECFFGQFTQLTKKVQKKQAFLKNTLSEFFTIESNLIEGIISSRRQITDENHLLKVDQKLSKIYRYIYLQSHNDFVGQEMSQLYSSLSLNQLMPHAEKYLDLYKQQTQKILRNIVHQRENCLELIFQIDQKPKQNTKVQRNSQNVQNQNSQIAELPQASNSTQLKLDSKSSKKILDSKILEQDSQQKIDYLFQQLNNPSQLQLLFRASQHKFLASQFHDHCNSTPNTFTIIKTEFNKTIAAFTPIEWKSSGYYQVDSSGQSFLLQLDLRQKMNLSKKVYAIYDNQKFGPGFGKVDIFISNKCHRNNQSYSNFPCSYSFGNKYKKQKQQSWLAFSGSPNGRNFKVLEYEVFKVIWRQ